MPETPVLLLCGVTGYTGALIARTARDAGMRPIVAGRDDARVNAAAAELGLEARVLGLDDPAAIDRALVGVGVVLNCAGPFRRTAGPLADACIRRGAHYLDLAGEVPEFIALAGRDAAARAAGSMIMPGVGFGVVPTDCLAMIVHRALPDATHLTLAFEAVGGASQGTLHTLLHDLHSPGVARRGGVLVAMRAGASQRRLDLGAGPRLAVYNPWRADLYSAYVSTGIADIDTFTVFPAPVRWLMRPTRARAWLLRGLQRVARRLPEGPSPAQLDRGRTHVYAEARVGDRRVVATLRGPEAYRFTALTAVEVARRVLAGAAPAGVQTPARAYGPDLVAAIAGVTITEVAT